MKRRRRRHIRMQPTGDLNAFYYWYHGILTFIWWLLLAGLVIKVDPEIVMNIGWRGSYLPFFVLIGLALGWTVGMMRKHIGKGLGWGFLISMYLFFRHLGLGSWLNAGLLFCLGLVAEWYWRLPNHDSSDEFGITKPTKHTTTKSD